MAAEEDALTVRRIGANAHVACDAELGHGFLHGANRSGHDVIGFARENGVLVLAIADAEDEQSGETRGRGSSPLAHHLGHRPSLEPARGLALLTSPDRTSNRPPH